MRKIRILAAATFAAMLLSGMASAQSLPQEIKDSGKLMVGTERDHRQHHPEDERPLHAIGQERRLIQCPYGIEEPQAGQSIDRDEQIERHIPAKQKPDPGQEISQKLGDAACHEGPTGARCMGRSTR